MAALHLINGCCAIDHPLCDRCVVDTFAQLRGTAACRGEVWAMSLATRVPRSIPWPAAGSEKVLAIARDKVRDLTKDERLLEKLAVELARWAARWWSAPASVPLADARRQRT